MQNTTLISGEKEVYSEVVVRKLELDMLRNSLSQLEKPSNMIISSLSRSTSSPVFPSNQNSVSLMTAQELSKSKH